jgi:hypothetical protein
MVDREHKKKYIKWYRLTRQVIDDEKIAPDLTDDQIVDLVSRNNWLPVASPDLMTEKQDVENSPYPNIFISLDEEKPEMDFGLVFNTIRSIDKIRESVLTPYSSEEKKKLVQLLRALNKNYETKVWRKIRPDYRQTPKYEFNSDCFGIQTYMINEKSIEEMFRCVNRIREEGVENRRILIERGKAKKSYTETPIIDLARITIPLDGGGYKKGIKELVNVYRVCLAIKTVAEIRKIRKSEAEEMENLKKEKKRLELISQLPQHPQYREAIKRLEKVRRRLEELEARGGNIEA